MARDRSNLFMTALKIGEGAWMDQEISTVCLICLPKWPMEAEPQHETTAGRYGYLQLHIVTGQMR